MAEGKVVTLGVGGVLSCLDAASGKLVWRNDPFPKVVPTFFTATSPIIVDGMAIAQLGGKGNGAILAYDLATGGEKWRWAREGPEYASPVVLTVDGAKQIVTLTEKSIVAVGVADGKLLWQRPFVPQMRAYNAATPIVDGQTVIYTGAGRGTIAVKIEKQGDGFAAKELWSNPDVARSTTPRCSTAGCSSASPTAAISSASTRRPARQPGPMPRRSIAAGSARWSTPARSSWRCPAVPN